MWLIIARRVTFVLALLAIGAVTVSCFHFAFNSKWAQSGSRSPILVAFGTFAWGADSLGLVLGAWLAGRHRIWETWSGSLRATVYVLAFTYGRMLFSATQNWLSQLSAGGGPVSPESGPVPFRWPGGHWQDFSRPALDLLTLLTLVWLLVPTFTAIRAKLCDAGDRPTKRPTFSILFLLSWTTVSALILMWLRLLTWKDVAPRTAYSYLTPTQAVFEYVTSYLPSEVIAATSVMIIVWAWSGRWWLPIVGLIAAVLVDGFGHSALYAVLRWTTGSSDHGGVLAGPLLEQWSYLAGRNFTTWTAFGLAAMSGVRLRWVGGDVLARPAKAIEGNGELT